MRIHSIPAFLFSITCFLSCLHQKESKELPGESSAPKGILFIIGGGDRDDSLMKLMLDVSGWKPHELITAITLCSAHDSAFFWINDQLEKMTGSRCVKFDSLAVHDEMKLDSLSRSKIIFIGGGDQSRMMKLIEGTAIKKIVQQAYSDGATIGGTSAGASIMTERMITGKQLLDTAYAATFPVIHSGNLELKEGLGLLDSVIIDQHFIARSRYNRMLSAILENPEYQCIGIDEAAAIIVRSDSATVAGESQVVVIENPGAVTKGNNHLIAGKNIHVSVYLPGEKFRIK